MVRRRILVTLVTVCALAAGTMSCLPWQVAQEGELVYAGPTEQGISPGDFMPGTDLQYVGLHKDGAAVMISGERAIKKKGDSLNWDGHPMEGTALNLKTRIVWFSEEKLHSAGTARLAVEDVEPTAEPFPDDPPIAYKLPTTYTVKRGDAIPGTTITYEGASDSGATLGGVEGYAYRKIADSIQWVGRLREGVFLDTTLRVVFFNDDTLQVAGLATVGLWP
jgi:hypothetical protein